MAAIAFIGSALFVGIVLRLIYKALHGGWVSSMSPERRERHERKLEIQRRKRGIRDVPPRPLLYGVGGSTSIPNPKYIAWYIEKYGCAPNMRRDNGYDGFLE